MPINQREIKKQQVEEIVVKFKKSQAIISHDFHGINHEDFRLLGRQLKKEAKADYKIFKNSLIKIAITSAIEKNSKRDDIKKMERGLKSFNGIIFCENDKYAPLKILDKFDQKMDDEKSRINWGVYDQEFVSGEELKEWARLPSKEEILQYLCYVLNYQPIRLMNVLKKITK